MEINDRHVEWAVVNRLKVMLETPPQSEFEVTQTFALFTTIVLWTKQRLWVGGRGEQAQPWFNERDHAARKLRDELGDAKIIDGPWSLAQEAPRPASAPESVNGDFSAMNARDFIEWLRNALAHSDGREAGGSKGGGRIAPLNHSSRKGGKSLDGFKISFAAKQGSETLLTASLYRADMVRIGSLLADAFCKALSDGEEYFERDAATASGKITEAA
jgi:hypothetical protein